MSITFLPPRGLPSVSVQSDLPAVGSQGECYLLSGIGQLWYWDLTHVAWMPTSAPISPTGAGATNSVNMTVDPVTDVLTADLFLSAASADAGNMKATAAIKTGATKGLLVEYPYATAAQDGVLAQADFSAFAGKVATTRTISTTAPLTGGGDLSGNRTLAISAATAIAVGAVSFEAGSSFNTDLANWDSSPVSVTIRYYRVGKMVTVSWETATSIFNSKQGTTNPVTITALPAEYRPASDLFCCCLRSMGGTAAIGLPIIHTDGTISIRNSAATSDAWNANSSCIIYQWCVSYPVA